ncbi:MAG: Rrf2 family transcriptional regulator [Elusimicrobia bacterium]|nr:Rrf2 family transcriptional regulator [Elusimicrobiota bacterium]
MRMNRTMMYALVCLWELAQTPCDWALATRIAAKHGLPIAYCYKVLEALFRVGLVESARGQGFRLARPLERITCLELVNACNGRPSQEAGLNLEFAKGFNSRIDGLLANLSIQDLVGTYNSQAQQG